MSGNKSSDFSRNRSGVRLENVTKIFRQPDTGKDFKAVDNVNLEVQPGEMVTLLGPSGCGKTTTLRMISGFEYPTSGSIFIGDADVARLPPNKRGLSMVFQSYALFPHMNIWENIAYGLRVAKLPRDEIISRTNAVITMMQLNGMERRFPNQISGGQQQRVALARAVVIEPKVLLFDEPLSNLDAKLRETMRDELRDMQKRLGITSLYVTHDQSEAMAISDRIVIMNGGHLIQMGTPEEIYKYPNCRFVANFIGKANFLPCSVSSVSGGVTEVRVGERRMCLSDPGPVLFAPGQDCTLCFRPESVRMSRSGDGLPGTVTRRTYFGSRVEYEAETAGITVTIEGYNIAGYEDFNVGDKVMLSPDPDFTRLVGTGELPDGIA